MMIIEDFISYVTNPQNSHYLQMLSICLSSLRVPMRGKKHYRILSIQIYDSSPLKLPGSPNKRLILGSYHNHTCGWYIVSLSHTFTVYTVGRTVRLRYRKNIISFAERQPQILAIWLVSLRCPMHDRQQYHILLKQIYLSITSQQYCHHW